MTENINDILQTAIKTIDNLNHEIELLKEERDFYKNELNDLLNFMRRINAQNKEV